MKFKYKKYLAGLGSRLRPVIPIQVSNLDTGKSTGYEVLIDSGSDICVFDIQIGTLLGFTFGKHNQEGQVRGITGNPEVLYKEEVEIRVGGWPFTITAYFKELPRDVRYGVVGQGGFFDLFVVKFDLLKEEIELKPRK